MYVNNNIIIIIIIIIMMTIKCIYSAPAHTSTRLLWAHYKVNKGKTLTWTHIGYKEVITHTIVQRV